MYISSYRHLLQHFHLYLRISLLGVLDSIRSNGANLVGVKMEDDGIDLSDLEEKLQIKPTPKFIYVIPNFQNPTGITMSLEKRKAVYELF